MAFISKCCFVSVHKGCVLSAIYVLFVYTITFLTDAVHLSTLEELSMQKNHRKYSFLECDALGALSRSPQEEGSECLFVYWFETNFV